MSFLILDNNFDKVQHLILGFFVAAITYFAAIILGQSEWRKQVAILASAAVGYAKEIWDKYRKGHTSCGIDFICTLVGGIAAVEVLP